MSDSKDVLELVPGDVFLFNGDLYICICATMGENHIINLHAMLLDDYANGHIERDFHFTCLKPRAFKVTQNVAREHIVVNIS
jgi:hypothetical protein